MEVHEGIVGTDPDAKTLEKNVLRAGYYSATMVQDANEYLKNCDKCQRHGDIFSSPYIELHILTSPWPFLQLGLDILGSFMTNQGHIKYLKIVVDYFTKWVEEEALANIMTTNVLKFFKWSILARLGVPQAIVTTMEYNL